MTKQQEKPLLLDHVDMRTVAADAFDSALDRNAIVQLDPDHPGFRDPGYRRRRNRIAQIALDYEQGAPIPDAPYTAEEDKLWHQIWEALAPVHQRLACAEYLECIKKLDLPRDRIPQLSEVSDKVRALSGFRLEPIGAWLSRACFSRISLTASFCARSTYGITQHPNTRPNPTLYMRSQVTPRRSRVSDWPNSTAL